MRGACFDKLSMRFFLNATKTLPYPELVEGRTALVQRAQLRRPCRMMRGSDGSEYAAGTSIVRASTSSEPVNL
jgi:hypothetical protein